MIGGFDLEILGPTSDEDLDVVLRVARERWPDGWVERGPYSVPTERFIYESRTAYDSWESHGRIDDNADKMLSVLMGADYIVFVVDREQSVTADLARSMIAAVQEDRRRPERKVGVMPKCTPTTDAKTSTDPNTTTAAPSGSLVH